MNCKVCSWISFEFRTSFWWYELEWVACNATAFKWLFSHVQNVILLVVIILKCFHQIFLWNWCVQYHITRMAWWQSMYEPHSSKEKKKNFNGNCVNICHLWFWFIVLYVWVLQFREEVNGFSKKWKKKKNANFKCFSWLAQVIGVFSRLSFERKPVTCKIQSVNVCGCVLVELNVQYIAYI